MNKRLTTEEFIKRSVIIHNNKYDYSKVNYINNSTKVCILCPKHGEFYQAPSKHLSGQGCPICKNDMLISFNNKARLECARSFIEKAKNIHGNKYDYSKVEYIGSKNNVCIICPKHGEFYMPPNAHLSGNKCPKCGLEDNHKKLSDDRYEFIWKAVQKHGYTYDYRKVNYVRSKNNVEIICKKHGSFWQKPNNHISGSICPICAKENIGLISKCENEIYDFIKEHYDKTIIRNDRSVIKPNELDLYLPDINIAFEFDGLYWHNELNKPKDYHLKKTKECNESNVNLIHIFEDEWIYKNDIVKSIILNAINKTNNKIHAEECNIKNVSYVDSENFLNNNHIQGNSDSIIRYGLYYNNELVSLMIFNKLEEYCYEMVRFTNKCYYNVVDSADKLLKHFINTINPKEIITYSDNKWNSGGLYINLGFKYVRDSDIDYYYVIGNRKYDKFELDRHETILNKHIHRIYDCGCKVFLYKNQ